MESGDYVLATKYCDGDPGDQFSVGFYDREEKGRHYVVDSDGDQFRENGFRRVAKISLARGEFIVKNTKEIEMGSRSVWWWKRTRMDD